MLGMDGGGTKTEVLLAKQDGTIIASHIGGPTNFAAISEGQALDNLEEALQKVFRGQKRVKISSAVVGMAGIDTPADAARFHRLADALLASFGIEQFQLLNDSEVALANGSTTEDGVILIAGTGSICFGRTAAGLTARSGGMDYLLADEGSGYWIGRKVLRAVVRSHDGRGPETALTPLVLEHFGITDVLELKQRVYQPLLTKMAIAQLATVWEAALATEDSSAKRIQTQVVEKLLEMIVAVVTKLELSQTSFNMVLSGSIAQLPAVEPQLSAGLRERYPSCSIKLPTTTPAHGAIKLALAGV